MQILDFLKGVLPDGTRYGFTFVKPTPEGKHGPAVDRMYDELNQKVINDIGYWTGQGFNAYYRTAGYGAANTTAATNAVSKKELYIDVDCGNEKPFPDKSAGAVALKEFVGVVGLPIPTIVDSGNGLHSHWLLNEAVPVHAWEQVAAKLKKAHAVAGFKVDGDCTKDKVRNLRFPGSVNQKSKTEAKIVTPIRYYSLEAIEVPLDKYLELNAEGAEVDSQEEILKQARETTGTVKYEQSEIQKLLAGNKVYKFQKIVEISLEGEGENGCKQIRYAIKNQTTLPEPLWRGWLSQAQYCEDRDWAIHEFSKEYPGYDAEETEKKAAGTKGPYTCDTYEGLDQGELCKGCVHKGKIKAPILLGAEVKKAPENKVVESDGVEYTFPTLPFPYYFAHNGGIYKKEEVVEEGDDGDKKKKHIDKVVYPLPLYIHKRMREPGRGDVCFLRLHLSLDGVREFSIAQRDIGALDRLRDRLSDEGVAAFSTPKITLIQGFFSAQIQDLQAKEKAEEVNKQFGWTSSGGFVIGNTEYTKDGPRHAPCVRDNELIAAAMKPAGDYKLWKQAIKVYEEPKYKLARVGILAGVASPFMYFSSETGFVVNLVAKKGGTGKTTIQRVINSFTGHHRKLLGNAADTQLSRLHRMGTYNGICFTLDEVTNDSAEAMSNGIYNTSHGRAKNRMRADTNAERTNTVTWKGISVWSSNQSIATKLLSFKNSPQGELGRLVEITINKASEGDEFYENKRKIDLIEENYGFAMRKLMEYTVKNMERVKDIFDKAENRIQQMRKWTQTDRFKIAGGAAIATVAVLCKELDILDFDTSECVNTWADLAFESAEEARGLQTGPVEAISQFINKHVQNFVIANSSNKINPALEEAALYKPRGALVIRYEPDIDALYIAHKEFSIWCAERYLNVKELLMQLKEETGAKVMSVKKRLGKGFDVSIGSVTAIEIMGAKAVLNIDELVEKKDE